MWSFLVSCNEKTKKHTIAAFMFLCLNSPFSSSKLIYANWGQITLYWLLSNQVIWLSLILRNLWESSLSAFYHFDNLVSSSAGKLWMGHQIERSSLSSHILSICKLSNQQCMDEVEGDDFTIRTNYSISDVWRISSIFGIMVATTMTISGQLIHYTIIIE